MIDKALVNKCIDGDRKSQKEFYYRHLHALKLVSLRYTIDVAEAKDVLQNAYVRIFKNLSRADLDKDSLVPWMRRIVVNEALRLKRIRFVEIKEEAGHHTVNATNLEHALNSLEVQDLMTIVNKLPDTYKTVFHLKEVEGFSHDEIGDMLGVKAATSRSMLTRAKAKLKHLLELHYSIKNDKNIRS